MVVVGNDEEVELNGIDGRPDFINTGIIEGTRETTNVGMQVGKNGFNDGINSGLKVGE